jgi:hypothetical protein
MLTIAMKTVKDKKKKKVNKQRLPEQTWQAANSH